jgi:hypothetical protein
MIVLLIITALNALAAGFSFMVEPGGGDLGISTDYLRHSPFRNFRIPGIVLFVFIGLGSLIAAIALIRKSNYAPVLVITESFLLGGWIIIQSIMLREVNWFHWVFLLMAVFFLVSGIFMRSASVK